MTRVRLVSAVLLSAVVLAPPALAPRPAQAAGAPLADSSTVERWTLGNGLRVVTRSIPRAADVAITVAYRNGSDDDPADHPGMAQLMGDVAFNSATADLPARSPEALDRDLPQGWSDPVQRHLTLLTEAAPRARLTELLTHAASRMRGVRLDPATLDAATRRTKRELAQQYFGDPMVALGFTAREIGAGLTDPQMLQRANGNGIAGLTAADLQAAMARAFVPANAVVSICGDLRGVELRAEIERLFGAIPGGTARPDAPERHLSATERILRRKGDPAAVIGIIAPPLSDSTHATFYMATLLYGGFADQNWGGDRTGGHRAALQYGLFDEPELVRFFPPVGPREGDLTLVDKRMSDLADLLRGAVVPSDSYTEMRSSVTWLMGGPMTATQRSLVRASRPAMMSLSRSQASCELRRGPAFWQRYVERLSKVGPGQPLAMLPYLLDKKHQVRVMALPAGH